ncbi:MULTISPECIES: fluoride efflux transporter family protein [unclassified Corynebacterium]|uniref:fluoride efflux transporter family protein n=1 Tax=unclassified Corynebacterium TaxID=2624378 RepID=UPI0029CA1D31|nr:MULTISPECIES: fluoride efflux transporter family protein [unclassified Corynebacterium]WPF65735.1 fluoride efflux transporter family protein [Corynebacterium sp. 22KM0430]WPF68230.1 fluoride efflux transporter family protein [Corynebacterium sp. 21KM1197]
MLRDATLVGSGAALGVAARLLATVLMNDLPSQWVLLLINVAGCFLMGLLNPGLFLGKGVLGGFTSFSAFALIMVQAPAPTAAAYLAATVLGCVGAWLLGHALSPGTAADTEKTS